jgi:radical SAM protein with 4Fe4S-binding SPASM domain
MFTNATLINEKNAASLLKGLDEIAISVDGATKETFEKIRFGANFEHVMKNIKLLTDMKKQTRSPTLLKISLTCNRLNYKEIPKLSALAPKLGIYHLEVNMLRESFFWRDTGAYGEKIHNELACSFSDIEKYLPKTANIRVTINPPGESFPNCTWPFRACYISDDGYVTPCCMCIEPEAKNFGNIFQTPLSKIWNNQKYQKFRQAFIDNKPPTVCQKCRSAIT